MLNNFTERDSLKRLVAVRQLARFSTRKQVNLSVQKEVVECLGPLLSREEEAVIREAALNILQILDALQMQLLDSSKPPV